MDANSQRKVIAEGFMIIRKDDQPTPRIKFKGGSHKEWSTLKKFETKAARDRDFNVLMALELVITD
jgi:hypothetical protein bfra3_16243